MDLSHPIDSSTPSTHSYAPTDSTTTPPTTYSPPLEVPQRVAVSSPPNLPSTTPPLLPRSHTASPPLQPVYLPTSPHGGRGFMNWISEHVGCPAVIVNGTETAKAQVAALTGLTLADLFQPFAGYGLCHNKHFVRTVNALTSPEIPLPELPHQLSASNLTDSCMLEHPSVNNRTIKESHQIPPPIDLSLSYTPSCSKSSPTAHNSSFPSSGSPRPSQESTKSKYKLRFVNIEATQYPHRSQAVASALRDAVLRTNPTDSQLTTYLTVPYPSPNSAASSSSCTSSSSSSSLSSQNLSLDWFREWSAVVFDSLRWAADSCLSQPTVLVYVVSTLDSNILDTIDQIQHSSHLPDLLRHGVMDSATTRVVVLLDFDDAVYTECRQAVIIQHDTLKCQSSTQPGHSSDTLPQQQQHQHQHQPQHQQHQGRTEIPALTFRSHMRSEDIVDTYNKIIENYPPNTCYLLRLGHTPSTQYHHTTEVYKTIRMLYYANLSVSFNPLSYNVTPTPPPPSSSTSSSTLPPSPPPALVTTASRFTHPLPPHYCVGLCWDDLSRLSMFVKDFLTPLSSQWLERKARQLESQVSSARRGLRNQLRYLWRKPRAGAVSAAAVSVAEQAGGAAEALLTVVGGAIAGGENTGLSGGGVGGVESGCLGEGAGGVKTGEGGKRREEIEGGKSVKQYKLNNVEWQMRMLGDMWFLLGEYDQALQHYKNSAADFRHDKSWSHVGSACDMCAICSYLCGGTRKDVASYTEQAYAYFVKAGRGELALRSVLIGNRVLLMLDPLNAPNHLCATRLLTANTELGPASMPSTSDGSSELETQVIAMRSGLLLEQAAWLLSRSKWGRRQGCFQYVLAGHTYNRAGFKRLAVRCYREVLASYSTDCDGCVRRLCSEEGDVVCGSSWRHISEHLHFMMARQAFGLGLLTESALQFCRLFNSLAESCELSLLTAGLSPLGREIIWGAGDGKGSSRTSPQREAGYLDEFLYVYKMLPSSSHEVDVLSSILGVGECLRLPVIYQRDNLGLFRNAVFVYLEGDCIPPVPTTTKLSPPNSPPLHTSPYPFPALPSFPTMCCCCHETPCLPSGLVAATRKQLEWQEHLLDLDPSLEPSPAAPARQCDVIGGEGGHSGGLYEGGRCVYPVGDRICAVGSVITVDVTLVNPLQIVLQCHGVQLCCSLRPLHHSKKGEGTKPSERLREQKTIMGDDTDVLYEPVYVQLEPRASKPVRLRVTVMTEGRLSVEGVQWDLFNIITVKQPLKVHSPTKLLNPNYQISSSDTLQLTEPPCDTYAFSVPGESIAWGACSHLTPTVGHLPQMPVLPAIDPHIEYSPPHFDAPLNIGVTDSGVSGARLDEGGVEKRGPEQDWCSEEVHGGGEYGREESLTTGKANGLSQHFNDSSSVQDPIPPSHWLRYSKPRMDSIGPSTKRGDIGEGVMWETFTRTRPGWRALADVGEGRRGGGRRVCWGRALLSYGNPLDVMRWRYVDLGRVGHATDKSLSVFVSNAVPRISVSLDGWGTLAGRGDNMVVGEPGVDGEAVDRGRFLLCGEAREFKLTLTNQGDSHAVISSVQILYAPRDVIIFNSTTLVQRESQMYGSSCKEGRDNGCMARTEEVCLKDPWKDYVCTYTSVEKAKRRKQRKMSVADKYKIAIRSVHRTHASTASETKTAARTPHTPLETFPATTANQHSPFPPSSSLSHHLTLQAPDTPGRYRLRFLVRITSSAAVPPSSPLWQPPPSKTSTQSGGLADGDSQCYRVCEVWVPHEEIVEVRRSLQIVWSPILHWTDRCQDVYLTGSLSNHSPHHNLVVSALHATAPLGVVAERKKLVDIGEGRGEVTDCRNGVGVQDDRCVSRGTSKSVEEKIYVSVCSLSTASGDDISAINFTRYPDNVESMSLPTNSLISIEPSQTLHILAKLSLSYSTAASLSPELASLPPSNNPLCPLWPSSCRSVNIRLSWATSQPTLPPSTTPSGVTSTRRGMSQSETVQLISSESLYPIAAHIIPSSSSLPPPSPPIGLSSPLISPDSTISKSSLTSVTVVVANTSSTTPLSVTCIADATASAYSLPISPLGSHYIDKPSCPYPLPIPIPASYPLSASWRRCLPFSHEICNSLDYLQHSLTSHPSPLTAPDLSDPSRLTSGISDSAEVSMLQSVGGYGVGCGQYYTSPINVLPQMIDSLKQPHILHSSSPVLAINGSTRGEGSDHVDDGDIMGMTECCDVLPLSRVWLGSTTVFGDDMGSYGGQAEQGGGKNSKERMFNISYGLNGCGFYWLGPVVRPLGILLPGAIRAFSLTACFPTPGVFDVNKFVFSISSVRYNPSSLHLMPSILGADPVCYTTDGREVTLNSVQTSNDRIGCRRKTNMDVCGLADVIERKEGNGPETETQNYGWIEDDAGRAVVVFGQPCLVYVSGNSDHDGTLYPQSHQLA
eukprot:GHVQ01032868.1.p1 GENE.GHVQ01032868.1~~GHVQ01032868.1.p1  ORF type:complete len:2426 (-),score=420.42 GHVQ01032868.1:366-7592(-)